jgi:hypothetical protein
MSDPCSAETSGMSDLTLGQFSVTCILDGSAPALPAPHILLHPVADPVPSAQCSQQAQQPPCEHYLVPGLHQQQQQGEQQGQGQEENVAPEQEMLHEGSILWPPGLQIDSTSDASDGRPPRHPQEDLTSCPCCSQRPYPAGALAVKGGLGGQCPTSESPQYEYATYEILLLEANTSYAAPGARVPGQQLHLAATAGDLAASLVATGLGPAGKGAAPTAYRCSPGGESRGTTGTITTVAVLGPRLYMTTNPVLSQSFAYFDSFQAYDRNSQVSRCDQHHEQRHHGFVCRCGGSDAVV